MTSERRKHVFGVGSPVTQDDAVITGTRLPTCNQVLRSYLYYRQNPTTTNQTNRECSRLVLDQVLTFYKKANIPTITEKKAIEKIIKLAEKNKKLRAISVDRRSSECTKGKLETEEVELKKTFQLWPENVQHLVTNEEDLMFLESMKTDRKASFGALDTAEKKKVDRKVARQNSETSMREREKERLELEAVCSPKPGCSTEPDQIEAPAAPSSDDTSDKEYEPGGPSFDRQRQVDKPQKRKTSGTGAFVPADILKSPKLSAMATRMKITPTRQAAYTKAMIEEIGGDSSKRFTSYSYAEKHRKIVNKDTVEHVKESWQMPKLSTLHWDSKLMSKLDNNDQQDERLVIAISTQDDMKVLGVLSYEPKTDQDTGSIVAGKTLELLEEWGCQESVVAMTFDTTASNTGHVTAACISIQQKTGKALLWSACRHHVGEVVLTHVFNDLKIEASKSPESSLFGRFRKHYGSLPHNPIRTLDLTSFSADGRQLAEELRAWSLIQCSSDSGLRRDDYKEVVDLCTLFLNGKNEQITFRKPGALHKARWMAKLIYTLKICMFEEQIGCLPDGTITTKQQVHKMRAFANFVSLVYIPWWLRTSNSCQAPYNDLDFYRKLKDYAQINPVISASAVTAFGRHLWYLTSEMVPLSLFCPDVSNEEKDRMSRELLNCKPADMSVIPVNRYGTGFGKPAFPDLRTVTRLSDLIDSDSWLLFRLLDLDTAFLSRPASEWDDDDELQQNMGKTRSIVSVNDIAERGVKLSSDFLETSRLEDVYQVILQVVEHDRKINPDLRKYTWKKPN
jgi:hypothetical protein